ncbi:MAG: ribosome assembly cofactor RimP [Flavobacteriaceae bacterium]
MFKSKVKALLEDCLKEREDIFLIDFDVLSDNTIKIVIDGDKGVSVEDCMFVSRAIEHNLDREQEDFSLEVSSAGATTPMSHIRQYKKNIGRTVGVKATNNQKFEAILTNANEDSITLEWKTREPKEIGKGKVTVQKKVELPYNDIIEAKVKIKF